MPGVWLATKRTRAPGWTSVTTKVTSAFAVIGACSSSSAALALPSVSATNGTIHRRSQII